MFDIKGNLFARLRILALYVLRKRLFKSFSGQAELIFLNIHNLRKLGICVLVRSKCRE